MQRLKIGKPSLVALALLLASGCRDSVPPKIEICILDGSGGADCVEADGSKKFRLPSELQNYWSTNEPDQSNLISWCYGASLEDTLKVMDQVKSGAQH